MLALCVSDAPLIKVAVVDVSASDAIYEDVSRGLADQVVEALNGAGLVAVRVDEREVPRGCRVGPCLEKIVRAQQAKVIVLVDATEVDSSKNGVGAAALWGADGRPLSAARYTVPIAGKGVPKKLTAFAADVAKRSFKLTPVVDAGVP